MRIKKWRPFSDFDDAFGNYGRLFNARMPRLFEFGEEDERQWAPSADISETKKEYLIKAELPNVEKDDIHVTIDNGALTIEGERKHEEEEKDETFHRVESLYGKFSRTFSLPSNVDESGINADCKNGMLRVHIPKTKESEPVEAKQISVK